VSACLAAGVSPLVAEEAAAQAAASKQARPAAQIVRNVWRSNPGMTGRSLPQRMPDIFGK
jgi:hypothetical protein